MRNGETMKQENKIVPRNLTYKKVFDHALEFFGHDRDKTLSWWMKKAEEFGNLSPFEMVKEGKGRRLIRMMEKCL